MRKADEIPAKTPQLRRYRSVTGVHPFLREALYLRRFDSAFRQSISRNSLANFDHDPSMPPEPPITTEGTIVERLDERSYRAALPNGKIVHAHLSKRLHEIPVFVAGDRVQLELTPYDFSRARIRPAASATDHHSSQSPEADHRP